MNEKVSNVKLAIVGLCLLVGFILGVVGMFNLVFKNSAPTTYVAYTVHEGDTVSNIANKYWNGDTREAIYYINQKNHLANAGSIHQGDVLQIPTNKGAN